jgi:hypothetical protein
MVNEPSHGFSSKQASVDFVTVTTIAASSDDLFALFESEVFIGSEFQIPLASVSVCAVDHSFVSFSSSHSMVVPEMLGFVYLYSHPVWLYF